MLPAFFSLCIYVLMFCYYFAIDMFLTDRYDLIMESLRLFAMLSHVLCIRYYTSRPMYSFPTRLLFLTLLTNITRLDLTFNLSALLRPDDLYFTPLTLER
jgi:thymidylate kinase